MNIYEEGVRLLEKKQSFVIASIISSTGSTPQIKRYSDDNKGRWIHIWNCWWWKNGSFLYRKELRSNKK